MKFPQKHSLNQIATIISSEFVGNADFPIFGMNEIHKVEPGELVFVDHPKYYDKALNSAASVILIDKKVDCPEGKALLISDDPFRDFNKLTNYFKPFEKAISSIAPSAEIGKNTDIQPNVFIGNHVKIGKNCRIHANVSIYDYAVIGDNVSIQAGAVLGGDAFYYKKRAEGFDKLISGGRVVLEDNVEIGALCTIDRGVSGDTIIGQGSKLDNQVHIGHDTVVGKNCMIAAQTGISGCVIVEDDVIIWGQVGVRSDVRITKGTEVLGQAGITKSTKGSKKLTGTPAVEAREFLKQMAGMRKIPAMIEKLKAESP